MNNNYKKIGIYLLILLSYLFLNIIFNFSYWKEVVYKDPIHYLSMIGESHTYEYFAEAVRQNILSGRSPFETLPNILYPTGRNFALDDSSPINGFFFLFLRPFLTIHQSLVFIMLFQVFLASICMFILLKMRKISTSVAFLFSLIFGFTPFLVMRYGHPSYVAIYLFPLLAIILLLLIKGKRLLLKILYSFCLGLVYSITVLTNLYYSIMLVILVLLLSSFYLLFEKKTIIKFVIQNVKYFIISLFFAILILFPWLLKVYEIYKFDKYGVSKSWVDSIYYSADFVNLFWPSQYNPFYKPILSLLTKFTNYKPLFEAFIYPGVIILGSCLTLMIFRKKIPGEIIKKIRPLYFTGISFLILSFGPFLQILGHNIKIPLPYILFEFVPIIKVSRAPGRWIVPFIFVACIVSAMVIDYFLSTKFKQKKKIFFIILIIIFLIDQSYNRGVKREEKYLPYNIYKYLNSQKTSGSLLDIPFSIRDGVQYFGEYNAVWTPWSQYIHNKPIFTLYAGRISEGTLHYYKKNPLFNPLAQLIDLRNKSYNTLNPTFDIGKMKDSIEFFNIEYIILKQDEIYSKKVQKIVSDLGYKGILDDNIYSLYFKKNNQKEFNKIDLASDVDLQLERGWSTKETNGTWTLGKISNVFLKVNKFGNYKISFTANTWIPAQRVYVYLDKIYVGSALISQQLSNYDFLIPKQIKPGIHMLTFKFSKTLSPAKYLPNNQDARILAAFFTEINLMKVNK